MTVALGVGIAAGVAVAGSGWAIPILLCGGFLVGLVAVRASSALVPLAASGIAFGVINVADVGLEPFDVSPPVAVLLGILFGVPGALAAALGVAARHGVASGR